MAKADKAQDIKYPGHKSTFDVAIITKMHESAGAAGLRCLDLSFFSRLFKLFTVSAYGDVPRGFNQSAARNSIHAWTWMDMHTYLSGAMKYQYIGL